MRSHTRHGVAVISDPISLDSLVTNAMMASKEVSDGWEGDQADGDGRAGGGISDGERASRSSSCGSCVGRRSMRSRARARCPRMSWRAGSEWSWRPAVAA